jgi:hypothetical protein
VFLKRRPSSLRLVLIGGTLSGLLLGIFVSISVFRQDRKLAYDEDRELRVPRGSDDSSKAPVHHADAPSGTGATVNSVGSEACQKCHPTRHSSYLLTAHSRAMSLIDPDTEPADGSFRHEVSGRAYSVYRSEGMMWHAETGLPPSPGPDESPVREFEPLPEVREPVKYRIGSGRHSRTYLVENDGFLMESPITWYRSTNDWRMSPGYDRAHHDGFERGADQGCIVCHVGRFEPIDGATNRLAILETAIGCERCHGPGAAHVDKWKDTTPESADSGTADHSIVHPGRLSRDRQEAICSQCHLRGDASVIRQGCSVTDFLPGQMLSETRVDYRLENNSGDMTVVGHMDQMYASRCYQQSSTFTCSTCHDSHAETPPDLSSDYYRNKCIECHTETDCGLSPQVRTQNHSSENCISCHMPQVSTDIPHIAFTHHRIGIHVDPKEDQPSPVASGRLVPLNELTDLTELQKLRCLGLAYYEYSHKQSDPAAAAHFRGEAIHLLKTVVASDITDGDVFAALSHYAWEANDTTTAMEYAKRAITCKDLTPKARVNCLLIIGDCYLQARQSQNAVAPLTELVKLRRYSQDWLLLGIAQFQSGDEQSGLHSVLKATLIQPFRPDLRQTLQDMQRAAGK